MNLLKKSICIITFLFCIITNLNAYEGGDLVSDWKFNVYMEDIIDAYNIPSLQACILKKKNGIWRIGWSNVYGYRQAISPKIPSDLETIYPIGSVTKPIVATAIMMLVEKGLIDLNQPAEDFLPIRIRSPFYDDIKITVRQMLNQRSSIGRGDMAFQMSLNYHTDSPFGDGPSAEFINPYPVKQKYGLLGPLKDGSVEYWLKKKISKDEYAMWYNEVPGTKFHYSNLNYIMLSYIIEEIINNNNEENYDWNENGNYWKSGEEKTWKDFVYKKILLPLKMYRTRFYWDDYDSKNHVREYFEKEFIDNPDWLFASVDEKKVIPRFIPKPGVSPIYSASLNTMYTLGGAAGMMKSTARDLAKFMIMILNKGEGYEWDQYGNVIDKVYIISEESINEMQNCITAQQNPEEFTGYGMGWYRQQLMGRYWTSPWNPDYSFSGSVNWGDPLNPSPDSLRHAGFYPENLKEGKSISIEGHAGDVFGAHAAMFYVPSSIPENDLGLIYFYNRAIPYGENRDESQLQPIKFKHYKNHFDGAEDCVTSVEFEEGNGALPHSRVMEYEVLHLLLHKGVMIK